MRIIRAKVPAVACALVLLGAAGCATAPRKKAEFVFFPGAPELPRVQFLTSFTGRQDVEEQSAFDKFVVGEKPNLRIDKPYGVAVHDRKIYVCDTNAGVVVFDLTEKSFRPLRGAVGPGGLRQPVNITIDRDGMTYVADPGRGQVVVFDSKEDFVKAYGAPGSWRPVDAIPLEGKLYVVDSANRLVKVFDMASGEIVRTIGDKGEPADRLDRPTNIAVDAEGYLYVTDVGRFQVVKFDRDGHFRSAFGKPGDNAGHFARPKGIALDKEGHLFAVDASFNNVQVFRNDGRLLMFFGEGGDKPGNLLLPAKVTIDYENVSYFEKYLAPGFQARFLLLVTSQFGPRAVNVFAFGEEKGRRYPTDEELFKKLEERRKKELEKIAAPPAKPVEPPPATPSEPPPAKPPGS